MNEHTATEIAFKNGYRKGKIDAIKKMQTLIKEECVTGGIYPTFVARVVENVGEKLLEGKSDV